MLSQQKLCKAYVLYFLYIYTFIPNSPYPNKKKNHKKSVNIGVKKINKKPLYNFSESANMQTTCMIFKLFKIVSGNFKPPTNQNIINATSFKNFNRVI